MLRVHEHWARAFSELRRSPTSSLPAYSSESEEGSQEDFFKVLTRQWRRKAPGHELRKGGTAVDLVRKSDILFRPPYQEEREGENGRRVDCAVSSIDLPHISGSFWCASFEKLGSLCLVWPEKTGQVNGNGALCV